MVNPRNKTVHLSLPQTTRNDEVHTIATQRASIFIGWIDRASVKVADMESATLSSRHARHLNDTEVSKFFVPP